MSTPPTFPLTTAGTTTPGNPEDPCSGHSGGGLNYNVVNKYGGVPDTAANHIINRHILPNPDPRATTYRNSADDPPWLLFNGMVKTQNFLAFTFSQPVSQGGTLVYDLHWPSFFLGVGVDKAGNLLHTNRLVIKSDCSSVITSYPTNP